jgi:hypothetical protein
MINDKLLKLKIYIKLFEIANRLIDLSGENTYIGDAGNSNNIPPTLKWWYTMYRLSPSLIRDISNLVPDELIDSNIVSILVISTNIIFYLYLLKIKYNEKEDKEEDSNNDTNIIE